VAAIAALAGALLAGLAVARSGDGYRCSGGGRPTVEPGILKALT
jgi:hypothetical protein